MQESVLNKLKQFESILKKCLQTRFGNILPQEKISLLNSTEFVDVNDLKGLTNRNDIQGAILRKMLNSLIRLSTKKTFTLKDSSTTIIDYGEDIEKGIIEYYAKEISKQYKFDINEIPELINSLEVTKQIKERLGIKFDKEVLNTTAIELFSNTELADIAKKYDSDILEKYIEDNIPKNPFDEYNQIIGSLEIIEINNQKYLKYTDQTHEEHLLKIKDENEALDLYNFKVSSLTPGEKINPEEFFGDLKKLINKDTAKNIESQKQVLPSNTLEQSTKNILDIAKNAAKSVSQSKPSVIKAVPLQVDNGLENKKTSPIKAVALEAKEQIQEKEVKDITSKNDTQKENDEQSFIDALSNKKIDDEAIEISNTIDLGTKDLFNDLLNPSEEIKNNTGSSLLDQAVNSDGEINSSNVLSKEKYEELCMKYARGEELTQEEYYSLLKSTPDLMTEEEIQLLEKSGKQLVPTIEASNSQYMGFGSKNMIFYLTLVTVVIGLIFGAILFKLTS